MSKSSTARSNKKASVKVEELAKEVNSYLNNSSDQYIVFKYR